jgi:zinc protease
MGDWRLFFLTRDRVKGVTLDDVRRVAGSFLKESNRTLGVFLPTKSPDRAPRPEAPDVGDMMKGYEGQAEVAQGEVFVASIENVEARTTRGALAGGAALALLPKRTKGGAVRLVLTLRYGSEPTLKGRVTAAGLVPQMLLRGTKRRTFQQIKDEFDRLRAEIGLGGGRFSVSTPGVTQLRMKTVRENLPPVLALIGEVLREPAFPAAEFETLRKEHLAQLEEQLQDPMANGFTTLTQKILPFGKDDVRYIPSVAETIARLQEVKLDEIAEVHRTLWGASAGQIALVGDLDEAETRARLEEAIGGFRAPTPYERIPRPYLPGEAAEALVDTPDKQMGFVGVGHPLELRDDDPDYPALMMLNHLLGGSASSRLLNRLRQKEGLSYSAFSGLQAHPQDRSGFVFAGAICAPENIDRAMAAMLEELARLLDEGVPAGELDDAKRSYAATWESRMAEDDYVAGELAQELYLGRTFAFWKGINERIAALAPEDVVAAARRHVRPERLAKVKAGDLRGRG